MSAKVKWERECWWVIVHHAGQRKWKQIGATKEHKRQAERIAEKINAAIALGTFKPKEEAKPLPFAAYAASWLRSEVQLPIDRGAAGALSHATGELHDRHARLYLTPFYGQQDLRSLRVPDVQRFYDHCLETGKPPSERSVEMLLATLRRILAYAEAREEIGRNPVEVWKRSRGRRRRGEGEEMEAANVLSAAEIAAFLGAAREKAPDALPLILFLADTGARLGEALALRWADVDLSAGHARIRRSFSSGKRLNPTKTGQSRSVELSARLRADLAANRPDLFGAETLVFPSETGGLLDPHNFRRAYRRAVEKAFGLGRRFTPHGLRHSFASLHMARGTPLKWIQAQGGWASAKVLLDVYGHHLPSESTGYADALSDSAGRHQTAPAESQAAELSASPASMPADSRAVPPGSRAPVRWARQGSNLRPPACKAGALTN